MGLQDLAISTSYDSGMNKILNEFYIKVLREAVSYKRIAGFFSSSSLAVSAKGISGLIENRGHMQLIVSPRLTKQDVEIIQKAKTFPESIIENCMLREINDMENFLKNNHVAALGWLLAKGILEIKIAVVCDENGKVLDYEEVNETGIFHSKIGIVEDSNGDVLSFSGSINETASAWTRNIEEFKVFKLWEEGQKEYCLADITKFNKYWNENVETVIIYDFPKAVKEKVIDLAPSDYNKVKKILENIDIEEAEISEDLDLGMNLFDYQKKAIELWIKNDYRLICEMATGTGKTRTAIGCMAKVLSKNNKIVIFIICPQSTLGLQWKTDIENLNIPISDFVIADSTVSGWKKELEYKLLGIATGMRKSCIVYTTFATFCKLDFINIVRTNKNGTTYMIIGDEVHGLGSGGRSKGLIEEYDLRLGLSATPDRWFDEFGTEVIKNYFGDTRFEFSIKEALNNINPLTGKTYLTPYKYIPIFTTLTNEETERYNNLSKRIIKLFNKAQSNEDAAIKMENLIFLRSNIHKSAFNKYSEFSKILDILGKELKDLIVFVSYEQMQEVINIVSKKNIRAHKFTKDEGKKKSKIYGDKSEREFIIDKFKSEDYQVLLAIKCLDEGIDIPSASIAILMASNTNPREYIQRIGRIIRRFPGKEKAILYDIIVVPSFTRMNPELFKLEKKIFNKEMIRVLEIAENATNSSEIIRDIFAVMKEA